MSLDEIKIPSCPMCQSHRVEGRSRREDGGEQYMAWVCNECSHQFEVIEVETLDNSLAARRRRKRWWLPGGRRR